MKKIVAVLTVFTLLLTMGVFTWADGGRESGGIGLECERVKSVGDETFVDVDVVIGRYVIGPEALDIDVRGSLIAPKDAILISNKVIVREVGVTDESEWCNMPRDASIEPRSDGRTYSVSWHEYSDYDYYSALHDALSEWFLNRSVDVSGGPVQVELVIRIRFLVKDPGIFSFSIQDMTAKGKWGNIDINEECSLKVCKTVSFDFIILCVAVVLLLLGFVGLGGYMIFTSRKKGGGGNSCCYAKEESEHTKKRKYKREHKRQLEKNSDFVPF